MTSPHSGHPVHRLPAVLTALFEWAQTPSAGSPRRGRSLAQRVHDACSEVLNIAEFDGTLYGRAGGAELEYDNQPLEVVPFAWNGGSGLQYAWLVLDEHLDPADYLCVSFAPGDEGGPNWLGDNTRAAMETMMVGGVRYAERFPDRVERSPLEAPAWATLCTALALAPPLERADVLAGGRTVRAEHSVAPHVPAGYRFEPTADGTGVLAPEGAFAEGPVEVDPEWYEDECIDAANAHLEAGHPASALVVLKATRAENPEWVPTVEAMRDAYEALDRPFMAARASAWLELHGDP